MSGRSVVWLTSRREILDRVRRRSFAVLTGLLCVVIVAAGVLASVLRDDDRTSYDVGVVAEASTLDRLEPALVSIGDSLDVDVAVDRLDDAAAARQALDDGDVDVVIDVGERTTLWKTDVGDELSGIVGNAWAVTSAAQAASDAGLSDGEVAAILSPEPLRDDVLEPDDDDLLGTLIGMGSAVLLFISITTFGNYVLTGVVEEKSTGVIEILLSHVRAHQLMAGKVFGIGTVALIQFAAAVVASMVALAISGVDVPNDIWVGLPVAVAWFIGGFLLYSTLFALAGSFVSRVEDAQSAAAPISTSFTVGYILVFIFGYDPTGVPATVLSMIPPFAPLLMPLRMITGAAPVWQVVVAAVLLVLSIAGMIRLAGSVYSRTLLHRGSRITWREAFRRRHDDTPIAA
jgi:ABC-2 type transport system permease protein